MTTKLRQNLEALLARGQDNKLLRLSLGSSCLDEGDAQAAVVHLEHCLAFDPEYSAAWKLYAKALVVTGQIEAAIAAYRQGIEIAEHKGDLQAVREMKVFLRRLEKGS